MKTVYKLIILGIYISVISCGVKSSPLPPEDKTPKPVNNLHLKQQGNLLVLYWNYAQTEDTKFEVYLNEKKLEFPIFKHNQLFWIEYPFNSFNTEYCFQIKVKRGLYSNTSNYKCIKTHKYSHFVENPQVSQDKDKVVIRWKSKNGKFYIYRGNNKQEIPPIPYSYEKNNNEFLDRNVESGKKYCYYLTKEENTVETNRVYTHCITYKDIYPPEIPKVSYIKKKENLIIILGTIKDKDFAGFLIEKNGKLITDIPLKTYYFIDKNYKNGDTYKIYSVDKEGNKSKPVYLKVE